MKLYCTTKLGNVSKSLAMQLLQLQKVMEPIWNTVIFCGGTVNQYGVSVLDTNVTHG